MEVPEPRTVTFIGAAGIDESIVAGEEAEKNLTQRAPGSDTEGTEKASAISDVERALG
jgi:hypothetical protein